MLISHFISTCLSHRTFKLHKSKMDSGLSPLNFFLPLGSLILVNNTTSPPSCSGPKIWCHPHLLLYLLSDSKANPLAILLALPPKYVLIWTLLTLSTASNQFSATSPSCQDLLNAHHPLWLFPTIHSSPGSQSDLLKMVNLVMPLLAKCLSGFPNPPL